MRFTHFVQTAIRSLSIVAVTSGVAGAQTPDAGEILKSYRPIHADVEYDIPEAGEVARCRVEIERGKGQEGYVVFGPAGQVLRRFTDTNADRKVDVYRYFRMGLEVYREIDSNRNEKADQFRWMNWGGSRWGLDTNEDGRIDEWKILSAQEAARIAVEAMIRGDAAALSSVMIAPAEIDQLQVSPEVAKQLQESSSDLAGRLRKTLTATKVVGKGAKWVRFDPPVPGLIPAEEGRAAKDLFVLENAMAIVQNGEKHDLVMIGEMVRVDEVWKLTQLPAPMEGTGTTTIQLGGILMQPRLAAEGGSGEAMSTEMQKLLADLQKVDETSPAADAVPADLAAWNIRRANLIEQLMLLPQSEEDRLQWTRQFADGIGLGTQTGEYPEGLNRLAALQEKVKASDDLLGYVSFRRLQAEYAVRLKKAANETEQGEAQTWWFSQLEAFAKRWPKSEDTSDAIVQLAISLELMGRLDDAKSWYQRLAKDYERTNAGIRARGALKRLSLTGTRIELAGRSLAGQPLSVAQYKGRVTLVVFWATWARPFTDDLPALHEVYEKHRSSGFEILGVNLDSSADVLQPYLKQHGIKWQSIRDAGGTDGELARDFGIVSVPTMFMIDRDGIVAGSIATANLETAVQTLLKGDKLEATRQPAKASAAGTTASPAARDEKNDVPRKSAAGGTRNPQKR